MRRYALLATAAAAALSAGAAFAQSAEGHQKELDELRARIDLLEAQQTTLQAQRVNSAAGFALGELVSLGDPDQIGQNHGLGNFSFSAGSSTTVTVYGFVRAEAFYDFDFRQGDTSNPGAVGDPALATDGEFDTSIRVSRFGIRSSTDTEIGKIGTQLEFDLFGSGGDQASSPNLRVRHANITVGDAWLLGQFWTNFMPLSHYPTTADFNGPVGITFARVPQIRYTWNAGNGLQLSTSLEEFNGATNSADPVLTAAAAYTSDTFSLRAAGLIGTFEAGGQTLDTEGLTVSGSFKPWQGGTFTASYVTGQALGNLLIGAGGAAASLQVGGVENEAEGFTIEYRQDLSEKLNVGIAYGSESFDLPIGIGAGGNSFNDLESLHVNAFFTPVENFTIGVEYIRLDSEGPGGFAASADRVGLSATLRF